MTLFRNPGRLAASTLAAACLLASLARGAAPPVVLVSATPSGLASSDRGAYTTLEQEVPHRLVSFDGRYVCFESTSTNLTSLPDNNNNPDIFERDLFTGVTQLVSVNQAGTGAGNGSSRDATISADGRFVCFVSTSTDLTTGVPAVQENVYVRDLQERKTVLVSATPAGSGADGASNSPVTSPDGHFVAFSSAADDLVSGIRYGQAPGPDTFLRDLQAADPAKATELVSGAVFQGTTYGVRGGHGRPAISADGRYVAFTTLTAALPNDFNSNADVYVRDRTNHTTELVSTTPAGKASAAGDSLDPVLSADGRFVAFLSDGADLVSGVHINPQQNNVYVRDRTSRSTVLASINAAGTSDGNGTSQTPAISTDGRYLAFLSMASDLDPDITDTNGKMDVYVRDLNFRATVLESVNLAGTGAVKGGTTTPALSDDGHYVTFACDPTGVTSDDMHGTTLEVFRRELFARQTELVSKNAAGSGSGNGASGLGPVEISGDGSTVLFASQASNLDPHDTNGAIQDLFAARLGAQPALQVTDPGLSPASLPASGGKVTLSVHVTSTAAITSVVAGVTPPAGAAVTVPLTHGAGTLYSGSFTVPANGTVGTQAYPVVFTAKDAGGRQASLSAGSIIVAGHAVGPAPVITGCTVTPARVSAAGSDRSVLTVSAQITAANGLSEADAYVDVGKGYGNYQGALVLVSGNTYRAQFRSLGANKTDADLPIAVRISASDKAGLLTKVDCPGAIQLKPEPPVITNCVTSPERLPYTGGTLTVSANVTAVGGLTNVYTEVSGGFGTVAGVLHGSGPVYSTSVVVPANNSSNAQILEVQITALDATQLITKTTCTGPLLAAPPPPVISHIRVTPETLPSAGGDVHFSARVTAHLPITVRYALKHQESDNGSEGSSGPMTRSTRRPHPYLAADNVGRNLTALRKRWTSRIIVEEPGGRTTTAAGPDIVQARRRGHR